MLTSSTIQMPRTKAGVPGPGSNGSGFTTASQHAAELQYIFNFGSAFTSAQATLATDMKTYWANFVKTGDPNRNSKDDLATLVSLRAPRTELPHWPHFNARGDHDDDGEIAITAIRRSSRSHRQRCSHRKGRIRSTASGPTISARLGSRCSPSTTAMSRSNPDLNSNRRSTTQSNRLQEPRTPCLTAGLFLGAPGMGRSTMTARFG